MPRIFGSTQPGQPDRASLYTFRSESFFLEFLSKSIPVGIRQQVPSSLTKMCFKP
jgi:hypothetical protein